MALVSEHVKSYSPTTKVIYLLYHNAYGNQTWRGRDLP